MAKSEYYEPKLLPGEKEQPSIPVDLDILLDLFLRAEPMMTAVNRRRYGDRAIDLILDAIGDFQNAYDFEDDRYEHLKKMCSTIAKFIRLARIIGERNAIELPLRHEPLSPNAMRLAIFERIASLDEGATKWRNSIVKKRQKGTTVSKEGGGGTITDKGDSTASPGGYE